MDSRDFNKIKAKYRFPIPRLKDMLNELGSAKWFSKVDVHSGYNHIKICPRDELKIVFNT